jgi:membrane-associated phospholipid phosphatase
MTRPDPQPPPEHSLRRFSGTRLLGGTTGAPRAAGARGAAGGDRQSGLAEAVTPLLPDRGRRAAAIAATCCAVVVAVLGVFAANRSRGSALDRPVDSWLRQNLGSHHQVMLDVAFLGGGQIGFGLAAVLILACLLARRVNGAILTLVSVPVSVGLTEYVLKPLVHETIGGSLTYPSGHTASVFTLTAAVGVLMLNPPRQRPRPLLRALLVAVLVVVSCAVAVATIVLSYHYFTDTIAGAALAVGVVLAATFPLDSSRVRRWLETATPSWLKPRPPRPPHPPA